MLPLDNREILNIDTVSSKATILTPFNTEDELKIESCGNSLLSWEVIGTSGTMINLFEKPLKYEQFHGMKLRARKGKLLLENLRSEKWCQFEGGTLLK
jgi:hypothetical protein